MTENQLRTALINVKEGLKKYIEIMDLFPRTDVSTDKNFQTFYNGFYKIRQRSEHFYSGYYSFMENHKNNMPTFIETLECLYQFGNLECSFASKLLATINPELPVWDKYVLEHFGLTGPSTRLEREERIMYANNVYEEIKQKYKDFLVTDESKYWIKLFDEYYPEYDITSIKKIDLIIWQSRG